MEAPPLERRLAAILAAGCRGLQPPDAWRRRNDDGHVCPPVHESCRPRPRAVAGARPRDRRGSDAETRRILRKRQRTPRSRFGSDIRDWRHRGRRSSSRRRDARMRRPDRAGKPIGPKHPGRCHQRRRWIPSQFASLPPGQTSRPTRGRDTCCSFSARRGRRKSHFSASAGPIRSEQRTGGTARGSGHRKRRLRDRRDRTCRHLAS